MGSRYSVVSRRISEILFWVILVLCVGAAIYAAISLSGTTWEIEGR